MSKARLLSTVAATLLLTAGIASAQTMKKDEAPAPAPAAQQKAPAEKIAPALKPHAQNAVAPKAHETTGQGTMKSPEKKGELKSEDKSKAKSAVKDDGKSEVKTHAKSDVKDNAKTHAKSDVKSKEHTGSNDAAKSSEKAASDNKHSTTGQGAGASAGKLSGEQRTKITTIFKQHKVESAHLNVSVRVGTRVPETVHFYPIPTEVIVLYPEWRGYDYIMVGDQIIVIDPRSHEIVAVLDA